MKKSDKKSQTSKKKNVTNRYKLVKKFAKK